MATHDPETNITAQPHLIQDLPQYFPTKDTASSSGLAGAGQATSSSDSSTIVQISPMGVQNEQLFADGYCITVPPLYFTVDSSGIFDISTNGNLKYPEEILSHAATDYDLNLLQKLKAEDRAQYENASAEQIKELLRGYEFMKAHGSRDRVHLLLKIGTILNDLNHTLGRAAFGKYQREKFENKHRRYFEHARQLARHYGVCFIYAALGKNRLLDLLRLLNKENLPDIEFIKAFGFIDIAEDEDGLLFKKQVDAILTLYRLHAAGIGFATFQDAELIVSYTKEALGVADAKKVKKQLDELSGDETGQQKAFDDYLKDKLIFKNDGETRAQSPPDLNKLLADFIAACDPEKLSDTRWAAFQREILCEDIFIEAHRRLHLIAEKLDILLNP